MINGVISGEDDKWTGDGGWDVLGTEERRRE